MAWQVSHPERQSDFWNLAYLKSRIFRNLILYTEKSLYRAGGECVNRDLSDILDFTATVIP